MIRESIQKLVERKNLTVKEAQETMDEVMSGEATPAQIGSLLTALRVKGETVEEITAFAKVMRHFCLQIHPKVSGRIVDTCGTGGDKIKTFNVSTVAAFVVAGTGIPVAKHGNRSVTSKSGSADVLERLGYNLSAESGDVERSIEEVGIGFMFAPNHHLAMKYAVGPRKEIGIRTVFNVLGPLTNPANAKAQLIGVYDNRFVEQLALVLRNLGCEEAMIVHGSDGLDEISTIGKTAIAHLKKEKVTLMETCPTDFGIKRADPGEILVTSPEESAETTFKILQGSSSNDPKTNMVLVNAAAGIVIGGKAEDFSQGIDLAKESIESGSAYKKLRAMIKACKGDLSKVEELEAKHGRLP